MLFQQELVRRAGMRAARQACGSTFEEVEEFLTSEIFPVASKSLFDIAPFLSIIISRSSNKLHTTSNSHRTIGDNTGVEAYGFGGIRRGQTLQFDGGGQGTFHQLLTVCLFWHVSHRPREQRGKDTNPLLERSSGCSRDVAWSE